MPSQSLQRWRRDAVRALDEIEAAHRAIGGVGRGRRYATQQINRAYAVLLSSQFQAYCRDLHTEVVDALVAATQPAALRPVFRANLMLNRQLDKVNVQPSSLGADFNRFGFRFWDKVEARGRRNAGRKKHLELLNNWRNAIAHHDFNPGLLGGHMVLRLAQVRQWRRSCDRLAHSFDAVLRDEVRALVGRPPWF
jgi:hypothetical protein